MRFASHRNKVHVAIYPFKIFIKSSKSKKVPRDLQETFKNYASCIHTFKLTDNFQNSRKKWKKREKKLTFRSSLPEVFYKKGVLKKLAKFTGKHLSQGLLFNKVAGLRLATLLKMRLWDMCFPVNFANFLRTLFLKNTSRDCFCTLNEYSMNYSTVF